ERIIELALIISDWKFTPLIEYEAVIYQPPEILEGMDEWNKRQHSSSGLVARVPYGKRQEAVEEEVIQLVQSHFPPSAGKPILCGNSIAQDRAFLNRYLPRLAQLLHYRMLDVTSWKIVFENKFQKKFQKRKNHRALDDIKESMEELRFYLGFVDSHLIVNHMPSSQKT
ncbi:MAG: oligoribonuclease, partial [Bdellovibrionaceae bacterium]|nr:oligoribonuclease [Pseudobdellovibrionaceae bacterium]